QLSGGQELTLLPIRLQPQTTMPQPATLNGRVLLYDGTPASGAALALDSADLDAGERVSTAGADGLFSFTNVTPDVYSLTASKPGYLSATATHFLVSGGTYQVADLYLGQIVMGTGGGQGGGG